MSLLSGCNDAENHLGNLMSACQLQVVASSGARALLAVRGFSSQRSEH
jgi:hypothetical protein